MRKKYIPFLKTFDFRKKIKIGVVGVKAGVGTTHMALTIANYLALTFGERIAYFAMEQGNCMRDFCTLQHMKEQEVGRVFEKQYVTYFCEVSKEEMISCLDAPFSYFVFDFGADYQENREEFVRCDIKVVMFSLAQWEINDTEAFIQYYYQTTYDIHQWFYFFVFGLKKERKKLERKNGIQIEQLPFYSDPCSIMGEQRKTIERVLRILFI